MSNNIVGLKSCILLVHRFGLELSLYGQHSAGHAIHFQSDGPTVCATSLPQVGEECIPRVTASVVETQTLALLLDNALKE